MEPPQSLNSGIHFHRLNNAFEAGSLHNYNVSVWLLYKLLRDLYLLCVYSILMDITSFTLVGDAPCSAHVLCSIKLMLHIQGFSEILCVIPSDVIKGSQEVAKILIYNFHTYGFY